MLINELHQGGIRALLDWEPSIFDGMQLPEGIEAAEVIDHIIYKYGDTPLFTPNPIIIKHYVTRWSARRLPLWERYKAAIEAEYNPIENYDRQEISSRLHESEQTHTGTDTSVQNGHVITTDTGSTTDQRAADNSPNWENFDKSIRDLSSDSESRNLTNALTRNLADTDEGSEEITSRIHGNIGVTTSQQMLTAELDLIPRLDLIDYIADDWHSEFNLLYY